MESHDLIHKLQIAEKVAWSLHGLPYRWGGDDPVEGFDCSGLCIEILKSVGILPREGDWTAAGLYEKFTEARCQNPRLGCLAFWWNNAKTRIIHVEFCLDSKHTMGASGGGSETTSADAAAAQNAYIKHRPIDFSHPRLAGFMDPFR